MSEKFKVRGEFIRSSLGWVERAKNAEKEVERLQAVIDSRPAINAALPDSYIKWSQSIYVMEMAHASGASS
jgi:hypothetical protein